MKSLFFLAAGLAALATAAASPAAAATAFHFSTGGPDGKLGALSQPANDSHAQTETADDFTVSQRTRLTGATFTGLLTGGAKITDIKDVEVEIYHVFPGDSASRTPGVPSRVNSPGDHEIDADTRDSADGSLSFDPQDVADQFSVLSSVTTGINGAQPFTGGDGAATGEEVTFNIRFTQPLLLDAGDLFFRPEVELANGSFLWLSAPKPIGAGGTPFATDRQAWIRNDALSPDWLRIGTDITHRPPVNMSFSLSGQAGVPEPATWALMIGGFGAMGSALRRRRAAVAA
jgi:PEP-CTERM motif-containing protein